MSDECKLIGEDWQNYGRRAAAALFRSDENPDQPGSYDLWEYQGNRYMVLGGGRDEKGFIAIYRIKSDGVLRRLRRFPACIVAAYKKP